MSARRRQSDGAAAVPTGGVSTEYITTELQPTAQRILAAAQRVLERDGYSGLTLQRVAAEAGEHKSLVIYHFGSKAALTAMLVDSLWHDLDVELFQSVEKLPASSTRRISALIDSQRRLGYLTVQQRMYLDLFAGVTRQRDTRRHLGELNRSYRELHQRFLSATGLEGEPLAALAGLVLAVGDGMAVSLLVRPDDIDDSRVYRVLEGMVLSLRDKVREGDHVQLSPAAGPCHRARRAGVVKDELQLGPSPLDDLAPVARKLVRGARAVLRKRGLNALTLEAVGREAGEPKSAITYYFGDKQGLVTALIGTQFHEQRRIALRLLGGSPGDRRDPTVAVCAARELLSDMASFRAFYDLVPVVTRDPGIRELQTDHDRWLTGLIADGLRASDSLALAAHADTLAVLEIAAADGLAMQVLSDPSGYDPQPSCAMLEYLLGHHVPDGSGEPSAPSAGTAR